jgi:hypothetical protein
MRHDTRAWNLLGRLRRLARLEHHQAGVAQVFG